MPQRRSSTTTAGVVSFFDHDTHPRQAREPSSTSSSVLGFGGSFGTSRLGPALRVDGDELTAETEVKHLPDLEGLSRKKVGALLHDTIELMQLKFKVTHKIVEREGGASAGALNEIDVVKKGIHAYIKDYEPKNGWPDSEKITYRKKRQTAMESWTEDDGLFAIHEKVLEWNAIAGFDKSILEDFPEKEVEDGVDVYETNKLLFHCFRLKAYIMLRKSAEFKAERGEDSADAEKIRDFLQYESEGVRLQEHVKILKARLKELREEAKERRAAREAAGGEGQAAASGGKSKKKKNRKARFAKGSGDSNAASEGSTRAASSTNPAPIRGRGGGPRGGRGGGSGRGPYVPKRPFQSV